MKQSPFKFLDAYTKADRDIFFGRDREIEELYHKVFENKILLIYGVSGTGKTSLINCGLGNKFEESDWLPVNVRRGTGIVEALWNQLKQYDISLQGKEQRATGNEETPSHRHTVAPSSDQAKGIVKLLQSVYLDHFKPIYLIFDQFEELFIFGSKEERQEFISIIKAIKDSDVQCKMLFSIREEYLASITEFERLIPEIMQNRMRVEKMSRSKAMDVISGPCKVHEIELEDGFEEALLDKLVPEGNEVELTYLQVFLDKVFKEASQQSSVGSGQSSGGLKFTISILDKLGNVSDLLGSFLEDQISQLENPDSGLTVLKSFVSIKGTKRQITYEEVFESCRSLGHEVEEEELKELINKFVDLRILRDKDENGRYELRHDSLAAKIYEKITLVEKEVMEVRLFIENAYRLFLTRKVKLSGDDLRYIESYEDRLFLTKELQDFVDGSKESLEAEKRSFRKIIVISIVGFILMVSAAFYYYYQKTKGNELEFPVIIAQLQREFSPQMSLLTLRDAYKEDSTQSMVVKFFLNSFNQVLDSDTMAQKKIFDFSPTISPIKSINLSDDGMLIYGWLENNDVVIWNLTGGELYTFSFQGSGIELMKLSPDNLYLGILRVDSTITFKSLLDSTEFIVATTLNGVNHKYLFEFAAREEYLAAVVEKNKIVLYDKLGNVYQELESHTSTVNALDISPDKRFLVTASDDASTTVWYFNTITGRYSLYQRLYQHKAPVRSCQFNAESNYILTASDDQSIRIKSLDDKINIEAMWWFEPDFGYFDDYIEDMSIVYQYKKSDAYFSEKGSLIVVENNLPDESPDSIKFKARLFLIHDNSSPFLASYRNHYVSASGYFWWGARSREVPRFSYLVPSPNERQLTTVIEDVNYMNVNSVNHLPLMRIEGSCPVYTSDSKYIVSISGNVLQKHVVDPEEVIKLVWIDKIFGELEYDSRDWVNY
ncbi:NACHT and WD repeat domain-containing protein [Bacteroidota bacterium]